MVWVSHSWTQNFWTCDALKIEICDFGQFSETYFAEILGDVRKTDPLDKLQTPSFQMVYRFGLCVMKTVG